MDTPVEEIVKIMLHMNLFLKRLDCIQGRIQDFKLGGAHLK
jgi:hypothetical protein